jgi:hypothetical protein
MAEPALARSPEPELRGDDPTVRVTYLEGQLEIMTPSGGHERLKTRPARLLEAVIRRALLAALLAGPIACTPKTPALERAPSGGFDPVRGSLARDEPQPIYAPDPDDPWNQAFYLLFTRTVAARVLADGASPLVGPGVDPLSVTDRSVTRIESGDRAIDPLYPSWHWMNSRAVDFDAGSQWRILQEPRYSRLLAALAQIRGSVESRPPLARALMQADLWSAHDLVFFEVQPRPWRPWRDHATALLAALAETIHALALTREEIVALPDNYAAGVAAGELPDVSGNRDGWMEIRWLTHRAHDAAAGYRRATRVFVRPRTWPDDVGAFLNQFRDHQGQHLDALDAVALRIQLLLVSRDGDVVASPITYEAQFRGAVAERRARPSVLQHELSRRALLASPGGSGLDAFDADAPAYLAAAGNDLSFAAPPRLDAPSIVAPLGTRCVLCHGTGAAVGTLMTFSFHIPPGRPVPAVERLAGGDVHAAAVARRKMEQDDFKALLAARRPGPG